MELREKIADLIYTEIGDALGELPARRQSDQLADRILAIPEIAQALRMKPVNTLGHSIKVNPPK